MLMLSAAGCQPVEKCRHTPKYAIMSNVAADAVADAASARCFVAALRAEGGVGDA